MEYKGHNKNVSGLACSAGCRKKLFPCSPVIPSSGVIMISSLSDEDILQKGKHDLVSLLRQLEADYKKLFAHSNSLIMEVNTCFQGLMLEATGLKDVNQTPNDNSQKFKGIDQKLLDDYQKLQDDNQELRDLCCFIDDDRRHIRKVADEWQHFGRHTAAIVHGELVTYQSKLRCLETEQAQLLVDNLDLKKLCIFLDQERLMGGQVNRDDGDDSSSGSTPHHQNCVGDGDMCQPSAGHDAPAKLADNPEPRRLAVSECESCRPTQLGDLLTSELKFHESSETSANGSLWRCPVSNPGKEQAITNSGPVFDAMKILHLHDRLACDNREFGLTDSQKTILRQICSVAWHKIRDANDGLTNQLSQCHLHHAKSDLGHDSLPAPEHNMPAEHLPHCCHLNCASGNSPVVLTSTSCRASSFLQLPQSKNACGNRSFALSAADGVTDLCHITNVSLSPSMYVCGNAQGGQVAECSRQGGCGVMGFVVSEATFGGGGGVHGGQCCQHAALTAHSPAGIMSPGSLCEAMKTTSHAVDGEPLHAERRDSHHRASRDGCRGDRGGSMNGCSGDRGANRNGYMGVSWNSCRGDRGASGNGCMGDRGASRNGFRGDIGANGNDCKGRQGCGIIVIDGSTPMGLRPTLANRISSVSCSGSGPIQRYSERLCRRAANVQSRSGNAASFTVLHHDRRLPFLSHSSIRQFRQACQVALTAAPGASSRYSAPRFHPCTVSRHHHVRCSSAGAPSNVASVRNWQSPPRPTVPVDRASHSGASLCVATPHRVYPQSDVYPFRQH